MTRRKGKAGRLVHALLPREREFQRAILERLQTMSLGLFWRQNSGLLVVGEGKSRRAIKAGAKGAGDIAGVLEHSGRYIEIEVKVSAPQTEHQRARGETLEQLGARYLLIRYDKSLTAQQNLDQAIATVQLAAKESNL